MSYPLLQLDPRRRRMRLPDDAPVIPSDRSAEPFFPIADPPTPIGEGERWAQRGIVPMPTIKERPASLRIGDARPMDLPNIQQAPSPYGGAEPDLPMRPSHMPVLPSEAPLITSEPLSPEMEADLKPMSRPGPYDQFNQPGAAQQRYEQLVRGGADKPKPGKWQRMKDVLSALAEGGPFAAMDVGANPQVRYDREHRIRLGQAEQEAGAESVLRGRRIGELETIGQQTGRHAGTQEPTEIARGRMANERLAGQRIENTSAANQLRREKAKQDYSHKTMQELQAAYNSGALNAQPDAKRAYGVRLAEQMGLDASVFDDVPDKFLSGAIKQIQTAQGTYGTQNLATGETTDTGVQSLDAKKLESLDKFRRALISTGAFNAQTQRMNANTSMESLNQRLDKQEADELKDATQFEDKAAEYDQQATLMTGAKQPNGQPYPPEMIEAAKARARHLRGQAVHMRERPRPSGRATNYPPLRADSKPGTYRSKSGKLFVVTDNPDGKHPNGHEAPQK